MKRIRLLEDCEEGKRDEVKFVASSTAEKLIEEGKAESVKRHPGRNITTKGG